jgi:hypothetical protein
MPELNILKQNIDEFLELKLQFSRFNNYESLDTYGFKCHFNSGQTQLMLFALTHGDEILIKDW